MRQSQLFTKTRKQVPADEEARNAQLLIQAGFIHKEMAGVYSYLPLGLRVLQNILHIIREEMNAIGGIEASLTSLQNPEIWKQTNRWSDDVVDNWFKTELKNGGELGLGFTHEEPLTNLMREYIHSYKDLPRCVYQIQTKFRNELRAKSGIMRGREFLMKDLYSFSKDDAEHQNFYEKAKAAYLKIFDRVGLKNDTYLTFASGGSFSKYSHEFQTVCEAGEDTIYIHEEKKIAINKEVLNDEVLSDLQITKNELTEKKSIEVGNIFSLGTKFSSALDLQFVDAEGVKKDVIMGSYGIGPGRVMGTIVELYNDEKGIVWPEAIAPYQVHLISLCREKDEIEQSDKIYEALKEKGVDVLYDDRDLRAGEKFADSDLIGIPVRVVVSPKTLANNSVEYKRRNEAENKILSIETLLNKNI